MRAELRECERDVRLLQRAVVLLSTADWAKGDWIWYLTVAETPRTLCGGPRRLRMEPQAASYELTSYKLPVWAS